ncbi:MAG TPA: carbohydrate ABC transporter permease [Kouleothrix sp.]|nr:carbohydrate ABC transporter permease [Kouleothrix sp.]
MGRVAFWVLIVIILVYTLFPFYWAIVSSLKPSTELFDTPVAYWPKNPTLDNYRAVFANPIFPLALRNSVIVTVSTVLLALVVGSLAAYALGRLRFRGRTFILYLTLSMTTFPAIAILGSLYQMIVGAGLYNRLAALIFSYTVFSLPFTVWVLTSFFRALPSELEEAAFVDGATPLQTFRMVLLPLTAPALVTTGLLAFIGAWNELLFALTFTQDYGDPEHFFNISTGARTAIVAVATFQGKTQFELPWGSIMAASVTLTIPLVLLVLIFQRRIMAGLTAGAVKG